MNDVPETQYGPFDLEVRGGVHTGEIELKGVPGLWQLYAVKP